jgi:hypothetical protein
LAALLAQIDPGQLEEPDLVTLMRLWARQVSHAQARFYDVMAMVGEAGLSTDADMADAWDSATSEIAAALSWTRRAAETGLDLASSLHDRVPDVLEALAEGRIDLPKARVIVNDLTSCDQETARAVAAHILSYAASHTTGQIGARLRRLVITTDPNEADRRYREGLEERRVWLEANVDGTANLYACNLPTDRACAAMRRINQTMRSAHQKEDERTSDQHRADVLLDLICGTENGSGSSRAGVDITVDLTTLIGLNETPGEIPGWGPVLADVARRVVADQGKSVWQVTVTDQGQPVWAGTTRRRPDKALQRRIQVSQPTCVFPGCRMPARQSDLDHTKSWSEGGPTSSGNLAPLCRHHHRLKHRNWQLSQTAEGLYQWTSPLGHRYQVGPDPP